MKYKILLAITMLYSTITFAYDASGPVTTVEYIYSGTTGGAPYISFGPNAMPGCYADNGGYLFSTNNSNIDQTYSLILAAYMSKKPVKVFYNFQDKPPGYNGWGLCQIEAIDVR